MYLRLQNRIAKISVQISNSEDYLFRPHNQKDESYTPNRLRQVFQVLLQNQWVKKDILSKIQLLALFKEIIS
jgi:hypothetical protein